MKNFSKATLITLTLGIIPLVSASTLDEKRILELMCGINADNYTLNGDKYETNIAGDYLRTPAGSESEDESVSYIDTNGELKNNSKYVIPKNFKDIYDGEPFKEKGVNENPYRYDGNYRPILSRKKNIKAISIDQEMCDLNIKNDFEPLYEVKPCSETPNGISFNEIIRIISNNLNPNISHSSAEEEGFPASVSHRTTGTSGSYTHTLNQIKTELQGKEICREETYAAEGKRKEYCNPQEMTIPQNAWVSSEEGVALNETMCRINIDKRIKIGSTINLNNVYEYNDQMKVMGYATVSCKLDRATNTPKLEILQNDTGECNTDNMSTFDPNSLEKCKNLCVFTDGLSCSPETIVWESGNELPRETTTPLSSCYAELPFGLPHDIITVDNQHPAFTGKSSFECSATGSGVYMWQSVGAEGADYNGIYRELNNCSPKN